MRARSLLLAIALTTGASAQTTDAACAAAFESLRGSGLFPRLESITTCGVLAEVVADSLDNAGLTAARLGVAHAIRPRDLQPARGAGGGGGGSAAQTEAVSSLGIEPFVGGSVSAVGTESGAGALATISLNPFVLGSSLDNSANLAAQTRRLDLSVIVPVDDADRDGDGRIDYIGVRSRYNVFGAADGADALEQLRAAYRVAFTEVLSASDDLSDDIVRALLAAPDPEACVQDLLAATGAGCTTQVVPVPTSLFAALDAAAAHVRAEVDRRYLGLDLRLDVGDPSLGTTPGADGFVLGALVAGGRTLNSTGLSSSLRGHVGAVYTRRDSLDATRFAVDAALGLAFSRVYNLQRIDLQVGLLGQFGVSGEDTGLDADRDRLLVSGSLNIPLTATQSASVRLALPLAGGGAEPVLSIGGNWHLPLPGRPGQ